MSSVSPKILAGFLAEAQDYVDALRKTLDGEQDEAGQALEKMHQQAQILGNGAEMLQLDAVASLALPAAEWLATLVETKASLTEENRQRLIDTLDQIEACLHRLSEDGKEPPDRVIEDAEALLPDLPPELLEIFALEAEEHNRAIQEGMERLRRSPGDFDALSEVRRVTHTLKGAAASIGFQEIARLAHLMEDLLEFHLEGSSPLTANALELVSDSADTLTILTEPGQLGKSDTAALGTFEARYAALLGDEAYAPSEAPAVPAFPAEEPDLPQVHRIENVLRLPQADIDRLINRVGDIVINRAALEGRLGALRVLLSELEHSARRLRRVARDVDTQVELTSPSSVEGQDVYDSMFDPLELERYSLLHQYTLELEEIAADASDINTRLDFLADDLDGALARERRLTTELQDGLLATRLVSFQELETRLRQTVRQTARDLGKLVDLILVGFETRVDKTILDTLTDPLMHLLRNAVDHGVEVPQARDTAGKPRTGLVVLSVSRERGRVMLNLSDDGAGIDLERVRRRAIVLGMVNENEHPGAEHLLNLLFEEGFSLAETVTQTSGRGVGLNIVRRAVSQLQGTVRVTTTAGRGTTITVSVPVTLAITRALLVRICGQTFAVPLEQITSVLRLDADALREIREQDVLRIEGRTLGVYNLAMFIDGSGSSAPERSYGLLIGTGSGETVVLVDGLVGIHETVIKSLGTHLRRVYGFSGATVSGDGRVLLILDLVELVGEEQPAVHVAPRRVLQAPSADNPRVLVVDDSLSVRRVVCSFLERVGWQATAAKDGIEALEEISNARPDVALVDIEMPRMNGYELLSRIRSDPEMQGIPVVFLTSRSAAKHRQRAEQLQVDGYIVKPYREDELLETLTRAARK